jgi:hypothetical protein
MGIALAKENLFTLLFPREFIASLHAKSDEPRASITSNLRESVKRNTFVFLAREWRERRSGCERGLTRRKL